MWKLIRISQWAFNVSWLIGMDKSIVLLAPGVKILMFYCHQTAEYQNNDCVSVTGAAQDWENTLDLVKAFCIGEPSLLESNNFGNINMKRIRVMFEKVFETSARTDIQVSNPFGNNLFWQRKTSVPVWGMAASGENSQGRWETLKPKTSLMTRADEW
jgi:hypothetical protein